MLKEEKTKKLLDFAQYMDEVEDDFAEISKVKKEIENKKGGAYSIWSNFLQAIARGMLLYSVLSVYASFAFGIKYQNISEVTKIDKMVSIVLNPIPFIFILTLILSGIFFYWASKERKNEINANKELRVLEARNKDLFSNIKEQYDGYENPPVAFQYSNPYFLLDVISYLEDSEEELSIDEAISRVTGIN